MSNKQKKHPEIMAPGGDISSAKAAILAGADSVYVGLKFFNARVRAENFNIHSLKSLVLLSHSHNCKIYLTLNSIINDQEFEQFHEILIQAEKINIDAVIVMDYGALYYIKKHFPKIVIHASTQLTTHNPAQVEFLGTWGISRVNLSRELSVKELKVLVAECKKNDIESEIFVHGAFCVSFSGQCYMSSVLYDQSANKGYCVQPCRRTYTDPGSGKKFLLFNLKDNNLLSHLETIKSLAIDSIKIEGRIKNFLYVYTIVNAYKKALKGRNACSLDIDLDNVNTVFHRDFTDGYFAGLIGPQMFSKASKDNSIQYLTEIKSFHAEKKILYFKEDVSIALNSLLSIFDVNKKFVCTGIIKEQITSSAYKFQIMHKLIKKILTGHQVYLHPHKELLPELKNKINEVDILRKSLKINFSGKAGSLLCADFITDEKKITVKSIQCLKPAKQRSLDKAYLFNKINKLKDTTYFLKEVSCSQLASNLFLPEKELNKIRQNALIALSGKTCPANKSFEIMPEKIIHNKIKNEIQRAFLFSDRNDLQEIRNLNALPIYEIPAVLQGNEKIYADFLDKNTDVIPFFPEIIIGKNLSLAVTLLDKCKSDFVITNNSGIAEIALKKNIAYIAGPAFNVMNSMALQGLKEYGKAAGAFLSYEIKKQDIKHIIIPRDFTIFKLEEKEHFLMNTRQCFFNDISSCGKKKIDNECLSVCEKKVELLDSQKNLIKIIKRPGFYTRVSIVGKKQPESDLKYFENINYCVEDIRKT